MALVYFLAAKSDNFVHNAEGGKVTGRPSAYLTLTNTQVGTLCGCRTKPDGVGTCTSDPTYDTTSANGAYVALVNAVDYRADRLQQMFFIGPKPAAGKTVQSASYVNTTEVDSTCTENSVTYVKYMVEIL